MIARVWRGRVETPKAHSYFDYLKATGLKDYAAVRGFQGVFVLRRIDGTTAEFVLISLWESIDAIKGFAGEDLERAVYYPKDAEFLLDFEPRVVHYDVLSQPPIDWVPDERSTRKSHE